MNLAKIRKGQFEGMPEKLLEPEWAPDFGERKIHPTAGIIAIGARMPLVAFNVNLDTDNVEIAKSIAKSIRGSSGGFKYCKAIGLLLEDRNVAQVSMNMVNYEGTPLYYAYEMIRALAHHRHGAGGSDPGQGADRLRGILSEAGKLRLPQAGDGVSPGGDGIRRTLCSLLN